MHAAPPLPRAVVVPSVSVSRSIARSLARSLLSRFPCAVMVVRHAPAVRDEVRAWDVVHVPRPRLPRLQLHAAVADFWLHAGVPCGQRRVMCVVWGVPVSELQRV
jgi:hypothetical protein